MTIIFNGTSSLDFFYTFYLGSILILILTVSCSSCQVTRIATCLTSTPPPCQKYQNVIGQHFPLSLHHRRLVRPLKLYPEIRRQ